MPVFYLTDRAGPYINGQPAHALPLRDGRPAIELTEDQAVFHLVNGEIENLPPPIPLPARLDAPARRSTPLEIVKD